MAAEAREIGVADAPESWRRLGFEAAADGSFPVGGVRIVAAGTAAGRGITHVAACGLAVERPDGLALVSTRDPAPQALTHRNGACALDHVVALTDDLDRTVAALEAAGLELRRVRRPPEAPARQAFLSFGPLILEVVETGKAPAAFWGLVAVVPDLEALGDVVGEPRDAVQPGRRIATVRREAGLSVPLAFMTPRR